MTRSAHRICCWLTAALVLCTLLLAPLAVWADEPGAATRLAYYPLRENVEDATGNGWNGAPVGNVTFDSEGMVLPGGANSATNYVELPGALFVGQNELTISFWLKANTNAGNYSALWFGTAANAGSLPENYWLFNPSNPSGLFKSVFTNSVSTSTPWGTEVGVVEHSTTGYNGVWVNYTTVITATSVTGYVNGQRINSAAKTRTTADFGNDLYAYIGRSNYLNDHTYAGTFRELDIYAGAMGDSEVAALYTGSNLYLELCLREAADALTLDNAAAVITDLALPTESLHGATVSWQSSNPAVVAEDGTVTLGEEAQTVELTATLALGGQTAAKTFAVTVVARGQVLDTVLNNLFVPYILTGADTLPTHVQGIAVKWSSSNPGVIDDDGSITPPASGMAEVTLTATAQAGGGSKTKVFPVKVIEAGAPNLVSYTSTTGSSIGKSMHLALDEGDGYEALNYNQGILFPLADLEAGSSGATKVLAGPYLFRKADGGFGVVAVRSNTDGNRDAAETASVLLFSSPDLVTFTEEGLLPLGDGVNVSNPICEYDAATGGYCLWWEDNGQWMRAATDLTEVGEAVPAARPGFVRTAETFIASAAPVNVLLVTAEEAKAVTNKFRTVVNTGVSQPVGVELPVGGELTAELLGNVTAYYSDGSTADKLVNWNLGAVNTDTPGSYTVTGTIKQTEYPFPLISDRADPNILFYNGKYYFIATDEAGHSRIYIRQADTILGLKTAQDNQIIYTGGDMTACLWAPELHVINDELYVFFAASPTNWQGVSCRVKKLKTGGDPTNRYDWEDAVKVVQKDGSPLYSGGITLDMTCFEQDGQYYAIWAQRPMNPTGTSDLFIATLDADEPWKLTSDPVRICAPDYAWDRNTTEVVEGPYALKKNGKLFVTFSGSGVDNTYCVGLLTADQSANLLDPASWVKTGYPILTAESVPGEYGPGHNSYAVDEDGNVINVYHAKYQSGARHANVRRVHWAADGAPVLDMTLDREILPEYRTVTATVIVTGPAEIPVTGVVLDKEELSLPVGGSEPLTATVAPANATNKEVIWRSSNEAVATVDNNGRVTAIAAGAATITVTTVDGEKTAACAVTVTAGSSGVESININTTAAITQLARNKTLQLTATVTPVQDITISWATSNPSVLKVDANGKVTGLKPGLVIVTARTPDGKIDSVIIRVTA